jgi:hypothetical protein
MTAIVSSKNHLCVDCYVSFVIFKNNHLYDCYCQQQKSFMCRLLCKFFFFLNNQLCDCYCQQSFLTKMCVITYIQHLCCTHFLPATDQINANEAVEDEIPTTTARTRSIAGLSVVRGRGVWPVAALHECSMRNSTVSCARCGLV